MEALPSINPQAPSIYCDTAEYGEGCHFGGLPDSLSYEGVPGVSLNKPSNDGLGVGEIDVDEGLMEHALPSAAAYDDITSEEMSYYRKNNHDPAKEWFNGVYPVSKNCPAQSACEYRVNQIVEAMVEQAGDPTLHSPKVLQKLGLAALAGHFAKNVGIYGYCANQGLCSGPLTKPISPTRAQTDEILRDLELFPGMEH